MTYINIMTCSSEQVGKLAVQSTVPTRKKWLLCNDYITENSVNSVKVIGKSQVMIGQDSSNALLMLTLPLVPCFSCFYFPPFTFLLPTSSCYISSSTFVAHCVIWYIFFILAAVSQEQRPYWWSAVWVWKHC